MMGHFGLRRFSALTATTPLPKKCPNILPHRRVGFDEPGILLFLKSFPGDSNTETKLRTTIWERADKEAGDLEGRTRGPGCQHSTLQEISTFPFSCYLMYLKSHGCLRAMAGHWTRSAGALHRTVFTTKAKILAQTKDV